jgi:hypothetical protein
MPAIHPKAPPISPPVPAPAPNAFRRFGLLFVSKVTGRTFVWEQNRNIVIREIASFQAVHHFFGLFVI